LACKGPSMPLGNTLAPARIQSQDIMDATFTWTELRDTLKRCRNNKAAGQDGIPCEAYKAAAADESGRLPLSRAIKSIANFCLRTGIVPSEWEDCTLVPIFKKGDRADLDNYRGITLINTLAKVILKALAARLAAAQARDQIIRKEQLGFIEGEEGLSAVMTTLEVCERRRINNVGTQLLFLDLQKAYDLVPQDLLIEKLTRAGLGPRFVRLVESLYQRTSVRVRIGSALSDTFLYERGVRQGCPLSPLLFDIFIDDLLSGITPIRTPGMMWGIAGLCFADDTLIFAKDAVDAQAKMDRVEGWMTANGMRINVKKCGVMVVGPSTAVPLIYQGAVIPRVETYVYLGIELNESLDYKAMAQFRLQKGRSALGAMTNVLRNQEISLEFKRWLVSGVLVPRAQYGVAIYAHNYAMLA
ncbi:hypothetical protein PAPHI01_2763, partial [Pancytospora philotis]